MNLVPTVLRLGLGMSVIVAAGLPLTWWLLPKRQGKGFIFEVAALSFGIGIGLTTLAMLFVSLGGGALSLPNILVSCFIVVCALTALLIGLVKRDPASAVRSGHSNSNRATVSSSKRGLSRWEIMLLLVIAFEIFFVFSEALAYPMQGHDPLSHWALKAKAFFIQGQLTFDGYSAHNYYPLLLPLSETWIYLGLGQLDDGVVKILFPLCFVALLITFYFGQRRARLSRTHSLLFTAILITSGGQLVYQFTNAYPDAPLAFFYTAATLFLYLWIVSPQTDAYLVLSGLFAGIAVWTKFEGVVLVVINSVALVAYCFSAWRNKQAPQLRMLVIHFSLIALFIVPWQIVRSDPTGATEHLGNLRLEALAIIPGQIIGAFFEYRRWGMLWVVAAPVITALAFRRSVSPPIVYVLAIVVLNLASLVAIYLFTSYQDVARQIQDTIHRMLLHFSPIVVFLMSLQVREIIRQHTTDAPRLAESATRQPPVSSVDSSMESV